jgi:hypothetical protein
MAWDGLGWHHQYECGLISFCPRCSEETVKPLRGKLKSVFLTAKGNRVMINRDMAKKNDRSIVMANYHVVDCPKHKLQIPRIKII